MKITTKQLAAIGIIAALYIAITVGLGAISFGIIQLRIAIAMSLLVYFNPRLAPAIILGNAIAGTFSPWGIINVVAGAVAPAIFTWLIAKCKSLLIASFMPTLIVPVVIGWMIVWAAGMPLTLGSWASVAAPLALSTFIVMTAMGYPLARLMQRNVWLMEKVRNI